ncbi:AAA domain-containing protein [Rhizobiales bacterium GAS113]|nr:AAA domain-containing protein [Rhizobiales bacterium GAS113]
MPRDDTRPPDPDDDFGISKLGPVEPDETETEELERRRQEREQRRRNAGKRHARKGQPTGPAESQDAVSPKRVSIIMGSNMQPQAIAWLWPGWLAHGKLHVLAGRPGSLKTTTVLDFAATVTGGGQWPDGSPATAGKVLIWSGEDAIDDTLLPRFLGAGGDPAQVAFISGVEEDGKKRSFDPARDMDGVAAVCTDLGEVNLVVIDPVVAVARGDSHKNAETRRDLQPLVELAERTQAVVIGVHHLTKRTEGADPVDRISGSLAFGAGPRVVLLNAMQGKATSEPHGVLMRAKNNLGPSHGGFDFAGDTRPLADYPHIAAQRILWGEYVDKSARDILEEIENKEGQAQQATRKAVAYLREELADGPCMAAEVIAKGVTLGFSERALRRALKAANGHSERAGFGKGGAWIWELPRLAS